MTNLFAEITVNIKYIQLVSLLHCQVIWPPTWPISLWPLSQKDCPPQSWTFGARAQQFINTDVTFKLTFVEQRLTGP